MEENLMKMNLQFFNEGAATASGAVGDAEAVQSQQPNKDEQPEHPKEEPKTYTQDELNKLLQTESGKSATHALKMFKEKELPGLLSGAKTEAEKLAKMTAEQRAQHEQQKSDEDFKERETRLAEREREATKRELKSEVISTLSEKGIPTELADIIVANCSNAESCSSTIETFEKAFRKAVEDGINARLKTNTPKKPDGKTEDIFLKGFNSN